MKYVLIYIFLIFYFLNTSAQSSDTEFPKGFTYHAKLHNGMITNFKSVPDLYVGGFQFIPQTTILENKLRAGLVAGGFYGNKKIEGQFGPTVSVKLKTVNAGVFGSAANVHATLDHIWGTGKQKLLGGGLHIDLLNKIVLGFTSHRDYQLSDWWFQTAIGIRLNKLKKIKGPNDE